MPAFAQQKKPAVTAPGPVTNADSAAATRAMIEHKGMWKWAVPPVKMKGAFANNDPIGLVAGVDSGRLLAHLVWRGAVERFRPMHLMAVHRKISFKGRTSSMRNWDCSFSGDGIIRTWTALEISA